MPLPIFNPRRVSKQDEDEPVGEQDAWMTIDKTVGKVDEEKVKDYMDDIDTLLVFAGLYSAVLTAFLIESYKTLTVDPTQDLLQRLVYQSANYQFTGGFLNTTFDISQLPVFEVSTSAIRVNVCWFASLVISLSTASYGILVKQWLREYLAVDRTAAHERIRIRHFRTQGIETWRLFDIAAILPMFLQLALTLFLVGICFFTAAVHESIGRTSLVLVCAWAFFLSLAVLAPLVSARCPYKTTFLKAAFRHLRPYASSLARMFVTLPFLAAKPLMILYICIRSLPAIATISDRYLKPGAHFIATVSTRLFAKAHACWCQLSAVLHTNHELDPAMVAPTDALSYRSLRDTIRDDRFHLEYMVLFAENTLEDRTTSWKEESTLRSDESADLIIFRDVDAIFLDDRILAMMREALQRRPPPGEDVLKFVVEVLEHRSDLVFRNLDAQSAEPVPWPWALSNNARTTLIEMLMHSLLAQISKTSVDDWWLASPGSNPHRFWMNQVLSLVFALSAGNGALPQSVSSALEGWLRDWSSNEICGILAYQLKADYMRLPKPISNKWQTHVLTLLLPVLKTLPTEDAAQAFTMMVYFSYGNLNTLIPTDFPQRTNELQPAGHQDDGDAEQAQDDKVSPFVILNLLDVAAGILNPLTVAQADKPEGAEPDCITAFPKSVQSLLDFIFQAIPFIQRTVPEAYLRSDLPISVIYLKALIRRLFTKSTPRRTHAFLEFWSKRTKDLRAHLNPDQLLLSALVSWSGLGENDAVKFLSTCASYFDAKLSSDTPLELVSAIRLCHLVYLIPASSEGEVLCAWHAMFASIIKCIEHSFPDSAVQRKAEEQLPQCTDENHTDTCSAASALLAELDADSGDGTQAYHSGLDRETTGYTAWSASFEVEESQMPDAMVKTLLRLVCEAHTKDAKGHTFWRVRRLHDLEAHRNHVETGTTELNEGAAAEDAPLPAMSTDEARPPYTVPAPIAPLAIPSTPTELVSTPAVQATPSSASPPSPAANSSSCTIHPSASHARTMDSEMHDAALHDPNHTLNLPTGSVTSQDATTVAAAQLATKIDIAEPAVSTNSGFDDETAAIAPDAQSRDIPASIQSLPVTPHDAGIVPESITPRAAEMVSASPEFVQPVVMPVAHAAGVLQAPAERADVERLEPRRSLSGTQAKSTLGETATMAEDGAVMEGGARNIDG